MINFENVESASIAFAGGEIPYEFEGLTISGVEYRYSRSSKITYKNLLSGRSDGFMIYAVHPRDKEKMQNAGLREWIALVYKKLKPKHLVVTSAARLKYRMDALTESQDNGRNVVGETVELRFVNLPSSSILKGKVDTGADICSLHCDRYDIDKATNRITFQCSHLSNNSITVPLSDIQAVKTADGVKNRPVIEMSVKIRDTVYESIKFNLKDRSEMDTPVLVGQNLLDKGNFLIDPTKTTTVDESQDIDSISNLDWQTISEILAELENADSDEADEIDIDDMNANVEEVDHQSLDNLFQTLRGCDNTFRELMDYAASYVQDEPDSSKMPDL